MGMNTRFIELAGEINTSMPNYVAQKVTESLNNIENIDFEELTSSLNKCFDLENKNEISLVESIRLIEYCLNIHEFD